MRGNKSGIASMLAIPSLIVGMSAMAEADNLILPRQSSDPIVLSVSNSGREPAEPSDLIKVFAAQTDACCDGRTPMAGRYEANDDAVAFVPAFGFDPSQNYVASVWNEDGPQLVAFRISSEQALVPAVVTEVFPSGDVLPENILRFYIHFSVPMQPHVAFDFIKLRDAEGNVDDAAFMRFKQELWNEDRTRLTVLIDPGRIKRNVATNVELGPALLTGRAYTLSLDAGWASADGTTLLSGYSKAFSVTDPLRSKPGIDPWQITAPCIGTKEPLQIAFDRPFDRHLLDKSIILAASDGLPVEGTIAVTSAESKWSFTPTHPWHLDTIKVHVDPTLEDVAANNFRDSLDHQEIEQINDILALVTTVGLRDCKE